MEITLTRKNDAFLMEGKGSSSAGVMIDASEAIGGHNLGVRPMELLLMGVASCSSIDVILALQKMRQNLQDIQVKVKGERTAIEGTHMQPFSAIHIHFILTGNIEQEKAERAIFLSQTKYCSASAQFKGSANITTSFEIKS